MLLKKISLMRFNDMLKLIPVIIQVQYLMKDVLVACMKANPSRTNPWAELDPDPEMAHLQNLPTDKYVRTFLARHNLVMRRSMPLNQGRAILTVADLREWQDLTERALITDPVMAEIMRDPRRIFNQVLFYHCEFEI